MTALVHVLTSSSGGPLCGAGDGTVDYPTRSTCADCWAEMERRTIVLIGGCEHWPPEQGMCGECGERLIRREGLT